MLPVQENSLCGSYKCENISAELQLEKRFTAKGLGREKKMLNPGARKAEGSRSRKRKL